MIESAKLYRGSIFRNQLENSVIQVNEVKNMLFVKRIFDAKALLPSRVYKLVSELLFIMEGYHSSLFRRQDRLFWLVNDNDRIKSKSYLIIWKYQESSEFV